VDDRDLLLLAAKAAGMKPDIDGWEARMPWIGSMTSGHAWNPLADDGDALRLANALKLSTCHTLCEAPTAHGTAMVGYAPWEKEAPICSERYDGIEGRDAATRRAIVRAAAEIGKGA